MSALTIYATAGFQEYADITITEATGKDISGDTFQVCLSTSTTPPATGWISPSVDTIGSGPSQRILKFLVSGTVSPVTAPGTYYLWAKILDANPGPEILPLRRYGSVTVI